MQELDAPNLTHLDYSSDQGQERIGNTVPIKTTEKLRELVIRGSMKGTWLKSVTTNLTKLEVLPFLFEKCHFIAASHYQQLRGAIPETTKILAQFLTDFRRMTNLRELKIQSYSPRNKGILNSFVELHR